MVNVLSSACLTVIGSSSLDIVRGWRAQQRSSFQNIKDRRGAVHPLAFSPAPWLLQLLPPRNLGCLADRQEAGEAVIGGRAE